MSNQREFLPRREADLVNWLSAFAAKVTLSAATYGVTPAEAASLQSAVDDFVDSFAKANSNDTRTPSAIVLKNQQKQLAIDAARQVAGIIQKFPGTTDEMRTDLSLNVRSQPQSHPRPTVIPRIDKVSMVGHTLTVRLHDGSNSRSFPAGVRGCTLFSFVGPQAPQDVSKYVFEGNATTQLLSVEFDPDLEPGTVVWVTAFYRNSKDESGPAAEPVSAVIQYGGMTQVA